MYQGRACRVTYTSSSGGVGLKAYDNINGDVPSELCRLITTREALDDAPQTPSGPVEITSEGELIVATPSELGLTKTYHGDDSGETTRALLLGFFRLVRVLQVIERGAHWTAQDLEAELSK